MHCYVPDCSIPLYVELAFKHSEDNTPKRNFVFILFSLCICCKLVTASFTLVHLFVLDGMLKSRSQSHSRCSAPVYVYVDFKNAFGMVDLLINLNCPSVGNVERVPAKYDINWWLLRKSAAGGNGCFIAFLPLSWLRQFILG